MSRPIPTRRICVSCKTVLIDTPPGPGGYVSHGLCETCLRARADDYGLTEEDIQEILAESEAERAGLGRDD